MAETRRWRYGAMMAALLLVACGQGVAGDRMPAPTITANGEAHLQAAPDQVHVDVGVVTQAADTDSALEDNNQRMRRVLAAIEALGIDRSDMETGRFSIQPRFSPANNRNDDPKIIGFTVTNRIMVTTARLELAGRIVAAAADAGANAIGNLRFDLQNSDALRSQALAMATRNALTDIATLAEAAGVKTGSIASINTTFATPVAAYEVAAPTARMALASAPPIENGSVSVRAQVNVSVHIVDQ